MRLEATYFLSGRAITIADSPDPIPYDDLQINWVQVVEVTPVIQGAFVSIFPRDNQENRISFSCTRSKDDAGRIFKGPVNALLWWWQHPQQLKGGGSDAIAGKGKLRLKISDDYGVAVLWLSGCATAQAAVTKQRGGLLTLKYEFIGQGLTLSDPN